MTITNSEAAELFNDFERFAARYGGIVERERFDAVIEFARARDPSAIRALTRIYRFVSSELLRDKAEERNNGKESQSFTV